MEQCFLSTKKKPCKPFLRNYLTAKNFSYEKYDIQFYLDSANGICFL